MINELDGLAKGQETDHRAGGYARVVQEKARKSIEFLERRFESRDSCLRALTSRGNELESIAFRSEDITGQLVRPPSRKGKSHSLLLEQGIQKGGTKGRSANLGSCHPGLGMGLPCLLDHSAIKSQPSRARAYRGRTLGCSPGNTPMPPRHGAPSCPMVLLTLSSSRVTTTT